MPKLANELGPLAVAKIKAPGLHFVGVVRGLALHVTATGARSWVLRIVIGGRRRDAGLGPFPEVTLAKAHERARALRDLVSKGIDPIEQRRSAVSAARAANAAALTFSECAAKCIAAKAPGWRNPKHAAQWAATLATYAYPVIGDLLVRDVGVAQVLEILQPIWSGKRETAGRVRGRVEAVLDWAVAAQVRPDGPNPARWKGHLDQLLTKRRAQACKHPALPIDDVPAFVARLRAADGMGARALEFAILTAARSDEVRGATWSEIDLDAAAWTLAGARMKAGREHRVPLSNAALSLLRALPRPAGARLAFPAPRGGKMSDSTLGAVIKRFNDADGGRWVDPKLGRPAVVHGFRSSFRDWCSERTNYPRDAAEAAIAHQIKDNTEASYRRGDLFDKRRPMMTDWATFVGTAAPKDNVVKLRARGAA